MDSAPFRTSGGVKGMYLRKISAPLMTMLLLNGCAYIPHKPLVDGTTSAQPAPASAPLPNGSIFQTVQPMNYGYQPLFEDRRPRNIGDTLTITLQENVSASKSSSANASRNGTSSFGVTTAPAIWTDYWVMGAPIWKSRATILLAARGRMPITPSAARSP